MAGFLYPVLQALGLRAANQQPQQSTMQGALGLQPDYSQPSVMNPYGAVMGSLMNERLRQQQFATQFARNPQQAIQATPQDISRGFQTALAFGGADITKAQREAWEAENAAYRAGQPTASPQPGQRVKFYPSASFGGEGTVVMPGSPEAGKPGPVPGGEDPNTPPGADWIAVRPSDSPYWTWRHRNELEMLPPLEEFPVGTKVQHVYGGAWTEAEVGSPPRNAQSPGPGYVWVDYVPAGDLTLPSGQRGEPMRPKGAWFKISDLVKK